MPVELKGMSFDPLYFGPEGITAEDCAYVGSRYKDVYVATKANPYYRIWGAAGEPPLPTYGVGLYHALRGILSRKWLFKEAAHRLVRAGSDLRWGENEQGVRRILHPNGVCLFGEWRIDYSLASKAGEPTPQIPNYTGYFQNGKKGLLIARYSTCCTETRRGFIRSLSLVGKIYPTDDADHQTPLRTANFITQQDIGGEKTWFVNDAVLRNAPNVTPWRRGFGIPVLLLTNIALTIGDFMPTVRQLYPIAELDKPADQPTCTPLYMQLTVAPGQKHVYDDDIDFRDEILSMMYDRGDRDKARDLIFDIEVTDEGESRGSACVRRAFKNWRKIGRLIFHEAVASRNGDYVVHFQHPQWRSDPNNPLTLVRSRD
jgi:hypothetical protein